MIGRRSLVQAVAEMLRPEDKQLLIKAHRSEDFNRWAMIDLKAERNGTPVRHRINKLMNPRNPNRTCKLLRRMKTTC